MQWNTIRKNLMGLAVLVILSLPQLVQASGKDKPGPKPLPPEVVKAWTDAGAHFSFGRVREDGIYMDFVQGPVPVDAVPMFDIGTWKENTIGNLPDPGAPFGLNLAVTRVTSAGLKELRGLKNLHALSLRGTGVTDWGMKELADLKNLHWLELEGVTQLTDAGLKELTGLKSLQSLNIGGSKVTDKRLLANDRRGAEGTDPPEKLAMAGP